MPWRLARPIVRSGNLAALFAVAALAFPASAAARSSVVGGTAAPPGSWPYAALVTANLGAEGSALCTGVVIAPTAVLTAAHCALDDNGAPLAPAALSAITGRLQWNDTTGGQELGVAAVAIDPAYSRATNTHDLAVLQLSAPTTAAPIRLATDEDLEKLPPGSDVAIAGYGQTASGQTTPQYQLVAGPMTLMAASACTIIYRSFDPATQLCVDSVGHDIEACHGDSGGPLVATIDGTPVLLGVTEGGVDPCGTEPTIYSAVTPALRFLDPLIGVTPPEPAPPPRNTRRPSVLLHAGQAGRLLCKIGRWNNRPTSYVYAWYWNGRREHIRSKAVVVHRDSGPGWVRCSVTALNASGTTTVRSTAVHVPR